MFSYVYILQSQKDGSLYIGSTTDLKRRMEEHNAGQVKSTKLKRPWQLVYYEAYFAEEIARKREKSLKSHGNLRRQLKDRIRSSLPLPPLN